MKYWFVLDMAQEIAKPILDGLGKELGVEIHTVWPRRRFGSGGATGKGFGLGWRYNFPKHGIEISFVVKPEDYAVESLKECGYRYCSGGFWWAHENSKSRSFIDVHPNIPHLEDVK